MLSYIITSLPPLLNDDNSVTNDCTKADLFIHSVFTVEDCSDLSSLTKSSNRLSPVIQTISFTAQEVFHELSQLSLYKACGPDLLTLLLLKKIAEFIHNYVGLYVIFLTKVCLWACFQLRVAGFLQMLSLFTTKEIIILRQITDSSA